MSLITRNAKEYRSVTALLMSQNLPIVSCPLGIFCVLRHPNHFVLAGANNRNVIITYRFLAWLKKRLLCGFYCIYSKIVAPDVVANSSGNKNAVEYPFHVDVTFFKVRHAFLLH